MKLSRAIALLVLVMATLVLIPTAPSLAARTPTQTSCKHMKIGIAIDTFKHIDGTPSLRSEWMIVGDQILIFQGSTPVQGIMPQDFYAIVSAPIVAGSIENGFFRYYEGSTLQAQAFTLSCLASPGTNHTLTPPRYCPVTQDEAVGQIGGITEYWRVTEATTHVTLNYLLAGNPLGSNSVPLNGTVVDNHDPGVTYYPGYRFPMTDAFTLTCWKEAAPPAIEPGTSPAP